MVVEAGVALLVFEGVFDLCDVAQVNTCATRRTHDHIPQFIDLIELTDDSHGVVLHPDLELATRNRDVLLRHRLLDIRQRQPGFVQFEQIDIDLHFALACTHHVYAVDLREGFDLVLHVFGVSF